MRSRMKCRPIRTIVALLGLSASIAPLSIAPQSVIDDLVVDRRIDWEQGTLLMSISAPIEIAARNRASAFHTSQQYIQAELPRLYQEMLRDLPINSRDLAEARIAASRGLLGRIAAGAGAATKVGSRQTIDLRRVEVEYSFRIFPDIGGLFIEHSLPSPIPRRIGWSPSDTFSGIVIYAADALPVRGEARFALASPTLFPTIYDSELRPILSATMLDPATLRRNGTVAYSSSLDPDDWQARVGLNPLRIVATELFGRFGADLLISEEDARRILSREHNRSLLQEARVTIVIAPSRISEQRVADR